MGIIINDFSAYAFKKFTESGMTPEGACGLIGNLYAESAGFHANRVEFLLIQRLREEKGQTWTDKTYTAAVDSGKITDDLFLHPLGDTRQYGYGLAQWTSPARKAKLYNEAHKRNVSIGDQTLAVDFVLSELQNDFPAILKALKSSKSVSDASDIVLSKYEIPADFEALKTARRDYSQQFYNAFCKSVVTAEQILKTLKSWVGYSEVNGKHRKIVDIYNSHKPYARGYKVSYTDDWCDITVSAAFIANDAVSLIGGTECGVEEHVNLFKKAGIWIEDKNIIPMPGDIITYDWNLDRWADHIGIVGKVDGNTITVIEGNYGDAVGYRVLTAGATNIRGYARPRYAKPNDSGSLPDGEQKQLNETPLRVGTVKSKANCRVWAGTEYTQIKTYPVLKKGWTVGICDTVKDVNGNDWYFIVRNGIYGFVSAKWIK